MVRVAVPRILMAASALFGIPAAGQETRAAACPTRRIARVDVETGDVFVASAKDPAPIRWAAGLANLIHIQTRSSFIRNELLFKAGDCLDSLLVAESQRLLAAYPFLREARVAVTNEGPEDAVVRVVTRDEWSTQLDAGLAYDGGLRLESLNATEINFLGSAVRADLRYVERRERRDQFYSISTPRLFGRANASTHYGRSRGGDFFGQTIAYPFIGETSRISLREVFGHSVDFVTYVADPTQPFSHLQIPTRREFTELAAARRFGTPGRSTIVGLGLSREWWRVSGAPLLVANGDFDGGISSAAPLPGPIATQMGDGALTLATVHLGRRRFRYIEMEGLDAVRDVQTVDLGHFAGVSLAKGLSSGAADNMVANGVLVRSHASFGRLLGVSFIHGSITTQAAHTSAGWQDVVAGGDLVGFGRAEWLPNHTVFLRLSGAGGWTMRSPHQLSLGGRDGVRSLVDDQIIGGRRVVLFVEDRVRLDRPNWGALDLGLTLFADAGRTWAADAPFGQNSPWFGSVGAGLRLGVPRGTHSAVRPDIAFPLGRGGKPVFRVTYEVNRYGYRFGTPRLWRGQPRLGGPEYF